MAAEQEAVKTSSELQAVTRISQLAVQARVTADSHRATAETPRRLLQLQLNGATAARDQVIAELHDVLSNLSAETGPVPGFPSLVLTKLATSTTVFASMQVQETTVTFLLRSQPTELIIAPRSDVLLVYWEDMQSYLAIGSRILYAGGPNDFMALCDFGRENGIFADIETPQLNDSRNFLDAFYL